MITISAITYHFVSSFKPSKIDLTFCYWKAENARKDYRKRLHLDLMFSWRDEKPTKFGRIVRYCRGVGLSGNGFLALKPHLTPELSSDKGFVVSSTAIVCFVANKQSWSNTTVQRFLKGIQFHTQSKDGANTSTQRNCYCYKDALQKHESDGSLAWFLHSYRWSFVRR